ncbi:Hypothetical protein A7982_04578 [Minicystis rosea]|nr:Hypothetical protein A7982_04578 [Minicystis rosea]
MNGKARALGMLAGLAMLAEGRAAADEPRARVALHWSAPAGCPEEARVAADIERLTGRRVEARSDGVAVDAEVSREEEGRWAVSISITTPRGMPGVRRVEGSTCREVAEATAVIVALAAQRKAEVAPGADAIEPVEAAPREHDIAPARKPQALGWSLAALGGVDAAALPSATAGIGVAGVLDFSGIAWRSERARGFRDRFRSRRLRARAWRSMQVRCATVARSWGRRSSSGSARASRLG